MSDIIPNQHFAFLEEQRARADKQAELNRQQLINIALTDGINKAFNEYTQTKDVNKFQNKLRTLGTMYGNDKLINFQMPGYLYLGDTKVPEGMEIFGYDQKGNPMIRKAKTDVSAEKFKAEQQDKAKQQEAEGQMVKDAAQDTLNTLDEIEKGIKYFGAAGSIPPFPAEYAKKNWKNNLDKVRSKLVVDLITRMKQASKTGATGFGQLSDKERVLLESAATALRGDLSEEDAQRYLNQIRSAAQKVLGVQAKTSGSGTGGTSNFVEGGIYKDKAGNKALFMGGQWVDPVTKVPLK